MKQVNQPSSQKQSIGVCNAKLIPGANEVQMFPAGEFRSEDTRPEDAPHWFINKQTAESIIAAVARLKTPRVIDYEHQTLLAKTNGKPAPAAGHFSKLEWRNGEGLFAIDVSWTDNAAAMIAAGEYRFNSPVFNYNPGTGEITGLLMSALTNNPGIDGMSEVVAAASAHFPQPETKEPTVTPDQLKLLNLQKGATDDQITAALTALAEKADSVAALTTQVESLQAAGTDNPDPSKFVPIAALTELQTTVNDLTASINGDKVNGAVTAALADGRLLPVLEPWARDLGKQDFASLTSFLDKAAPVAALSSTQTGSKTPPGDPAAALTAEDKQMCALLGVPANDYQKTLEADQS